MMLLRLGGGDCTAGEPVDTQTNAPDNSLLRRPVVHMVHRLDVASLAGVAVMLRQT